MRACRFKTGDIVAIHGNATFRGMVSHTSASGAYFHVYVREIYPDGTHGELDFFLDSQLIKKGKEST
jgi:hypothetical protein